MCKAQIDRITKRQINSAWSLKGQYLGAMMMRSRNRVGLVLLGSGLNPVPWQSKGELWAGQLDLDF